MIRTLTCAAAASGLALAPPAHASTAGPAETATRRATATSGTVRIPAVGMGLNGKANHRRPIPGEVQVVRWTVRNLGRQVITQAWLDTTVPYGWRVEDAAGCLVTGRRVHCAFGPLGRATVVLTMTAGARLGPVRLRAVTGFAAAGREYAGPAARLRLTVVRHR